MTSAQSSQAAALYRLVFPQPWERSWSAAEFSALLATPGCFGHLLVEPGDGAACGLILLRAAADEAEILTLGVTPQRRRRGGAARLLEQAMADCAARAVRTVFLDVAEDNEPARGLYERHGFSVSGRRPSYYARGAAPAAAALVMSRALSYK
ncbi:MAG: GNAT family N-acetyltransferase [Alphaproteobacteria bacterium]|nr:GNAT family N-acetyltransferase [Alphaproteobacteria bacterium]MCW5743314.1 GNAT family N-acetyltransferase [Alphaproteobacteria bacterium]